MIRLIPIIILLMACQKDELLNPVDPELTEAQCIELGYQDECGVCDVDTSNDGFMDECGECDSDATNDCIQDCAGTWGGTSYADECGGCDANTNNDCIQDCAGEWDGDAVVDNCNICDSDSSNDCVQDCAGEWGGELVEDECGVCDGGNADDLGCGCFEPGPSGCDNTCGSTLEFDDCGVCDGFGINPNGWQVATDGSIDLNLLYCDWNSYQEGLDWAYISLDNHTLNNCAYQCEETEGCTAFEYNGSYCAFWFNGNCLNADWENSPGLAIGNTYLISQGIYTYWYTGECDCAGNLLDCSNVCGGDAIDTDGDGICD